MINAITEEILHDKITSTEYAPMGRKTTVCVLTLVNGFEVVGTSACVDPSNFDFEIGKKYAFEDAFNKLWELEGYRLQNDLYITKQSDK